MMGFGIGFGILHLFCLIFGLGIILFIIWAVRVLDKKQLKKWVVSFLVIGILGMALSSLLMFKMGNWDKNWKGGQEGGFFGRCGGVNNEVVEEVPAS